MDHPTDLSPGPPAGFGAGASSAAVAAARPRARRGPTFALFLAVVSLVLGGIHFYVWQRLFVAPGLPAQVAGAGGIALAVLCVATPVGMILGRALPRAVAAWVAMAANVWFGLAALLFFGLLASEVVRALIYAAAALGWVDLDATSISRGIAVAVAGAAALFAIYGAVRALGPVPVRRVEVELARLPASLSGYRIVQLSDMHVGPTRGARFVRSVVRRVNALEPDLVAITGDLVDGSVDRLRSDVAPLAELRARHGVFFVTGNHEYYSGADAWVRELGRLGIRVLRNERVEIAGEGGASFDLAGVDDFAAFGPGHGRDLERALRGRDERRELVLLAHQPKQLREAVDRGVGLQLSGHTHGGQILPWRPFVRLDQPTIDGLERFGATQIYTSRGTGYWGPPMRVGAPPEITLLALRAATARG